MSFHSNSEAEPVLSGSDLTVSSTDTNEFASPSLKQKHLNKDCPHLVPLDFQIIIYEEEEDEENESLKPKRSWLQKLFFGTKSVKAVSDDIDGSKKSNNKRNALWSMIGFGCVIVLSVLVIYRRPLFSLGH